MNPEFDAAVASEIPEGLARLANQQDRSQAELLGLDNVVGVGLGRKVEANEETETDSLVVFVSQKLPKELLPDNQMVKKTINRIPTDVIEAGTFLAGGCACGSGPAGAAGSIEDVGGTDGTGRADGALQEVDALTLRNRVRPVRPGYSVGHPQVTAGTIGAGCYDLTPMPGEPPRYYILSNNHVLANSNNASVGDLIIQPGRVDGGQLRRDAIGRLARFVPIRFIQGEEAPCNYVDAAIAEVPFDLIDRDIYWNGYPQSLYKTAEVGMLVKKTGRTTNFTTGRVSAINATVDVNYGSGNVARFCRQIITTDMSAGGDSGSLVLDLENNPVGLLFAGSSTQTILNPIAWVQGLLRVRVWP